MAANSKVDVELGLPNGSPCPNQLNTIPVGRGGRWSHKPKPSSVLGIITRLKHKRGRDNRMKHFVQIEDYPAGYPQFSALISSHESFSIFRGFLNLRTRMLLLKQDKLALLEKRLEKLDRDESVLLRLGSCRSDDNCERNAVVSEIDTALANYDALMERTNRVFSLKAPKSRHVSALQNWVNGNGCVAREETNYLNHFRDLLSVTNVEDNALAGVETIIEKSLTRLRGCCSQRSRVDVSRDPCVHIFPREVTIWAARIVLIPLITIILLAPVVICSIVQSLTSRLIVIITATTCFISILSSLTKARTVELAVAGATYSTVLIVFITGND